MNAAEVKMKAREFGADLVGIAPVDRLDNLPSEHHPRTVLPAARSVVVVGHRLLRGALRGVEEGTNFGSTYHCYGYDWPENSFLIRTVYQLSCCLEDAGYEAVPLLARGNYNDRFQPDCRQTAQAAGLGIIGKSGWFLTPEYGHRQRLALVITTAELAGEPEIILDFCRDCRKCLESWPLDAMSEPAEGEAFQIDYECCRTCKNGAVAEPGLPEPVDRYAASCGRACLVALAGRTGEEFVHPFRKRRVWSIGPANPVDPQRDRTNHDSAANSGRK